MSPTQRLPILIALICAAALAQAPEPTPAPEYKSWDRERLEVAYQARCDELEQVKKDLAEAKERIKQLEDAAAGQQNAQPRRHYPIKVIPYLMSVQPRHVGDKSTLAAMEKSLREKLIGAEIDDLGKDTKPYKLTLDTGIVYTVGIRREGQGAKVKSVAVRFQNNIYEIWLLVE